MSDLLSLLLTFKNQLRKKDIAPQKRTVAMPAAKRPAPAPVPVVKKARPTPVGPVAAGLLAQLSANFMIAVEFIKKSDEPVLVARLQQELPGVPNIRERLIPLMQKVDRIVYDREAQTLQYTLFHNIHSADDLLRYLRQQPTFRGTPVKELEDGWSGCHAAIDQLEEEGHVIVLRTKKENKPRLVWPNNGPRLGGVEPKFVEMWTQLRPPEPDQIYKGLIAMGLKPSSMDPMAVKVAAPVERKQKKPRRGKTTNVHMIGILKDYSQS